jgi:hypothetical protein
MRYIMVDGHLLRDLDLKQLPDFPIEKLRGT